MFWEAFFGVEALAVVWANWDVRGLAFVDIAPKLKEGE
jgi:hypothetical protein